MHPPHPVDFFSMSLSENDHIVKSPYLAFVFLALSPALVVGDVESRQSARAGRLITKQALTKAWHSLDMIFHKASNGFDGVAILEFGSQGIRRGGCVFFFICLQGPLKKGLKVRGFRLAGHVAFKDMSDMHP